MPSLAYRDSTHPIDDAVTSAVNTTDGTLPPDVIALITQRVVQELQAHIVSPISSTQPVRLSQGTNVDQADANSSAQGSPVIGRATVYTPPSPHRVDEKGQEPGSIPTRPTTANPSTQSAAGKSDLSSFIHDSSEDAVFSDAESRSGRPDAPRRLSTDPNATVLEKHWGKLFDGQGQSTDKLDCFLRGIALNLIEDVEPKHGIVITPDKMQKFYEDTKLDELPEIYPWHLVFDDKTSSISRLLRDPDIKVEHHLVQSALDARPEIPALTPAGFAAWMVLLIRAHPDHEHERLSKALRVMAVNHPEEKGRFPAAISRRLFPSVGDEGIASRLAELMGIHCKIQVPSRHGSVVTNPEREPRPQPPMSPKKSYVPPAPTVEDVVDESEWPTPIPRQHPRERAPPPTQDPRERAPPPNQDPRERAPPIILDQKEHANSFSTTRSSFSQQRFGSLQSDTEMQKTQSVTSFEDDDDLPTPQPPQRPIERERKPYIAQPGHGKSYEVAGSGDEKSERPDNSQMPATNDLRRTKSVSGPPKQRMPPPVAIHQRPAHLPPPPADMTEQSRSRSVVVADDDSARHRTRSNSYAAESRPFRRSRSNSTYVNEAGTRYYPQRSPSYTKTAFEVPTPRSTAPGDINYGSHTATVYPPPSDRYDYTRTSNYEPRETRYDREKSRDRDTDPRSRPRLQGTAVLDKSFTSDDYFRAQAAYVNGNGIPHSAGGGYVYPPTAYRDGGK